MLRWFRRKKRLAEFPAAPPPPPDTADVVAAMKEAEVNGRLEPGKALHTLVYDELLVRIDRDILGLIRITASQGEERRFSFSIMTSEESWESSLDTVFTFLASDRALKHLPKGPDVKGHFYGFD